VTRERGWSSLGIEKVVLLEPFSRKQQCNRLSFRGFKSRASRGVPIARVSSSQRVGNEREHAFIGARITSREDNYVEDCLPRASIRRPVAQGESLITHCYLLDHDSLYLNLNLYITGVGPKGEVLELSAKNMLKIQGPSGFKSLSSRLMYQ
jgi:hypothetical protein